VKKKNRSPWPRTFNINTVKTPVQRKYTTEYKYKYLLKCVHYNFIKMLMKYTQIPPEVQNDVVIYSNIQLI